MASRDEQAGSGSESSDDEEYNPEQDKEEAEEAALDAAAKLEDAEDDPHDDEAAKAGPAKAGSKRKAKDAELISGRRHRGGGIALEGDDALPSTSANEPPEEEEEEEPEAVAEPKVEAPKPKSKVDDLWEEMKRGATEKKPQKPSGNVSAFIQGLVAKSGGGGSSSNIAAMFPTTVKQKQTYKVEQELNFAGEKVKVHKEVEVGSVEDKKLQGKGGGPKKTNLDALVERLTGKQKKMSATLKTEHDWMQYKEKEGLEDELSTYRKDGYLEKQRFLKNSDAKLEETLKEERQKEREARAKAAHAASIARGP